MSKLERVTIDPNRIGGKPCFRGLRVPVGMIGGPIAVDKSRNRILKLSSYFEPAIDDALAYAAWRMEEQEVAVAGA